MRNFRQGRGTGSNRGGFNRRDGGRPNFYRKSFSGSGSRDRGPVTMFQAVCDQCGKPCEVPFRPTSGKPVYCDVCFRDKKETKNNRGDDRFPQGNVSQGNNDELKKQLETLNIKMDQLIKTVENMTNAEPLAVGKKAKKG